MRLATLRTPRGTRAGRIEGTTVVELPFDDVGALLRSGEDWPTAASASGPTIQLVEADLGPPVVAPSKVICLGLNYRSHIEEMGREIPEHPTLFAKFAATLTGPRDPITLPAESSAPDWEAELAVIVGRRIRRATTDEALPAIAGYSVANDISMRDWQWRTAQWLQGKAFEATTPIGPALVTPDELDDRSGKPDLEISCTVDGTVMQHARTGDLLFGPAEIIAYISAIITLEPGDLILTGTPGGIGAGREPPLRLAPGQVVTTAIEGIGELVNRCT